MSKFLQNPDSEENIARWGLNLSATEELDDWSSEWQEVLQGKGVWGGRKRGGRGVQRITGQTKDISVEGLTLAFCGRELLQRTSLKLVAGHRYGLIGENGVGKSTLLRRMAKQTIPGIPLHFRFGYVQQELLVAEDCSVLDYVLSRVGGAAGGVDDQLNTLRDEEAELEAEMEKETDSERLGQLAEQLCDVVEQMEALEKHSAEEDDQRKKVGQDAGEITRASIEALVSRFVNIL
ncbi:ATP-binding cassette domain-containing protein [archaeon]|nr:MAG: ATP-binding cassette domain-containing protein [archaeon]